ncbi:MAG: hypothetical protein HY066_15140 [Betaproteobacteria bacterium]|nr:hypothetical protein [Betaproteobacteria bacterium]
MKTANANFRSPTVLLAQVLLADAVSCLVMALMLVFFSADLAVLLNLPSVLLWWAGAILFPSAGLMVYCAMQPAPSIFLLRLIVAGNLLWLIASLVLPITWLSPNRLGWTFLTVQAVFVAVITGFEHRAARGIKVVI